WTSPRSETNLDISYFARSHRQAIATQPGAQACLGISDGQVQHLLRVTQVRHVRMEPTHRTRTDLRRAELQIDAAHGLDFERKPDYFLDEGVMAGHDPQRDESRAGRHELIGWEADLEGQFAGFARKQADLIQ